MKTLDEAIDLRKDKQGEKTLLEYQDRVKSLIIEIRDSKSVNRLAWELLNTNNDPFMIVRVAICEGILIGIDMEKND